MGEDIQPYQQNVQIQFICTTQAFKVKAKYRLNLSDLSSLSILHQKKLFYVVLSYVSKLAPFLKSREIASEAVIMAFQSPASVVGSALLETCVFGLLNFGLN